ncbi:MAG: TolC family protein [Caulobacteraceae bacterium]
MAVHGPIAPGVALLAAMMLAGAAGAAPLTYQAALANALATAPGLEAKGVDVRAARSAAVAAGRLPDPKLSVSATDFPISGPLAGRPDRDNFSMLTVGVSQDVPNAAKRRAGKARARAEISQAGAARLLEARKVAIAAGVAWIDLYYAEKRLAALDQVDQALVPLRASAPAQLASGSERPSQTVEPAQLTAALADRRADLVAAVAKARAELGRWVEGGQTAEPAGEPPGDTIDPVALRANLDDLPQLRVDAADIEAAEANAQAAQADKRSDWAYGLDYSHRDPRFGDYLSAKVTVSLPIFAASRQDPVIAARLAAVNSAILQRRQSRRDLAAALESDLADHVMHHERLMRAREALVPLAVRRAHLEAASYAGGNASLSDVLSTFLALAEAKVDLVDREAEVARDGVRILLTYGSEPQ